MFYCLYIIGALKNGVLKLHPPKKFSMAHDRVYVSVKMRDVENLVRIVSSHILDYARVVTDTAGDLFEREL